MDIVDYVIKQLNSGVQADKDKNIMRKIQVACWTRVGWKLGNIYLLVLKHGCRPVSIPVANGEYLVYLHFDDPNLEPFIVRLNPNDEQPGI